MKVRLSAVMVIIAAVLLMASVTFARFDLQSYEEQASLLNTSTSLSIIKSFAVGSTNPTIGIDDAELRLEFVTAAKLSFNQHSLLALLPGYSAHGPTRSRFCIIDDEGSVIKSSQWMKYSEFTGSFVDSSTVLSSATSVSAVTTLPDDLFVSPYSRPEITNPLRIFLLAPFDVAAGFRVRIEIRGLIAPPTFSDIDEACLTAYGKASANDLLVNSDDCCKSFNLILGQSLGISVPGVSAQFASIAAISATWCPNLGIDSEEYLPQICADITPENWNDYYTNVCCAYSFYARTDRCTPFVCANQRVIDPTDKERCCNVPTSRIRNNPYCPLCSYGNFKSDYCCDYFSPPLANSTSGVWTINEQHFTYYENYWQCAPQFCNCIPEDSADQTSKCCFLSERFHGHVHDSPYYTDSACLETCATSFFQGCCDHPEYAYTQECICSKTGGSYNPDLCCGRPDTHVAAKCPISDTCPTEESQCCDNNCDDEDSCSVLIELTDENDDNTHVNAVHRNIHRFVADDIQSGHNTILINHIHVETHVRLPNGSIVTLESLVPDVLMSVNSEVYGLVPGIPATPAQVIGNIIKDIKEGIQNDIKSVVNVVKDVGSDMKNVVSGAIGAGGAVATTIGKPVRGVLRCLNLPGPLSGLQLVSIQLLFVAKLTALGSTSGKNYKVAWVNQYPTSISASVSGASTLATSSSDGYGLTYEVTEASTSQADLITQITSIRNSLSSDIEKTVGGQVDMTSPLATSAQNSDHQGELYSPCTGDKDCLSGKCSNKICVDADSVSNSAFVHSISVAVLLIVAIVTFF